MYVIPSRDTSAISAVLSSFSHHDSLLCHWEDLSRVLLHVSAESACPLCQKLASEVRHVTAALPKSNIFQVYFLWCRQSHGMIHRQHYWVGNLKKVSLPDRRWWETPCKFECHSVGEHLCKKLLCSQTKPLIF